VNLNLLHSTPRPPDIVSSIVYSAQATDVLTVIIDGRLVMHDRELLTMDGRAVIEEANQQAQALAERAGI
jgi:cytosine/adenosine deaminase-related metal-dependent hydrolase